jgi:hypothetical protein
MLNYLNSAFPVLIPLVLVIAVEFALIRSLRTRDGDVNFFELGIFYSGIVFLYCVFPAIEYLVSGLRFAVLSDYRLYRADPTPTDVAPIFWYYVLYLACFAIAYRLFRSPGASEPKPVSRVNPKLLGLLVGAYGCTYAFFALLKVMWNLRTPESYSDTYLLYSNLPGPVQFLANHMIGAALLLQLVLMAFLVLHYRRYKLYIYLWLLVELVGIFIFGVGSRTGLMVLLLTFAITYNSFVKRLSLRVTSSIGLVLIILFIVLGIIRGVSSAVDDRDYSFFRSSNEFDALFANAYDLSQLKAAGRVDDIFPRVYFADLTRMLPDEIFPSAHVDPSKWYVDNFYPSYSDQGGGFAFGAISESIVGLGWFDVIWRGLLVGWAFAAVQRIYRAGKHSFWNYAFYLWVIVFSYQTFRVTTLNLLPRALGMLILWWCAKFALNLVQSFGRRSPRLDRQSTIPGLSGAN